MKEARSVSRNTEGFAPVGLAVTVVILGMLASFAIPHVHKTVERSRASESFGYLSAVKAAQERFHARNGSFTNDIADLNFKLQAPRFFAVGTIDAGSTGSIKDSWTLTLTREGASDGFGAYTVSFTEDGFNNNPTASTISDADHSSIFPL